MRLLFPFAFCFVAAAEFLESGRKDAFGSINSFQGFNTGLKLARDAFLEPRLATGACDDSTPCVNGACCSVSGFCGYSPAFCGSGNCTSNCNAKAECGEYAVEGEQDCPLNVCCSQFGFCGTTTDFCGTGCQSGYGSCGDVTEPSCSGNTASQKIIAYYETWSTERPCDAISPSDLNLAGFTHLNMAFAYFDPSSFTITSMDANMASMLSGFTAVKSKYSGLETWISVGGWSFTDPGSTQEAWSNMASSSSNRAAFINSLVQFMKTYGFDGVDLDWEYPGASDRGGSTEDGANFVLLLSDMRAAFGQTYGISVTLPTSYWYLQGFLPVKMEEYVDWFNLMAYDLHGTWDATDIYTGPYIEPHTNLTEISAALDLLWRAGVTPGKVVLGQGWYGRSFTLADPSCNTPNGVCQFTTGGNPGPCTATSGILSNAEIQVIIAEYGVTPVYDEVDAVNYITWAGNQWVSYDDDITYAQKLSFANDLCLGGMMVWAVDLANQSMPTGYGSQADTGLSEKATNYTNQLTVNAQAGMACYTSKCGQDCLSGYSGVTNMNGQPGSLPTALDCPSGEVETLCCASGTTMGTCTWRGWRGQGLPCSGGCNSGETLVAQNTNHHATVNGKLEDQTCNGGLQSYCCEGFKGPPSQSVNTNSLDISQDDVVGDVVSVIRATVTEAIANAAKSVVDAIATDFCEVAVPEFLDVVTDIELEIPILGEIAIAIEWAEEKNIVKDCEKLFEDAGDAILSWAGITTTLKTEIVETLTSTVTSSAEPECAQDSCVNGCSSKNKIRALEELRAGPARNLDPRVTDTPMPPVLAKRTDPVWGNLGKPGTGELDAWVPNVFGTTSGHSGNLYLMPDNPDYGGSDMVFVPFSAEAPSPAGSAPQVYVAEYDQLGCTTIVIASHQGVLMSHHWEVPNFKQARTGNTAAFQSNVIQYIQNMIAELPITFSTSGEGLQVVIISKGSNTDGQYASIYAPQLASIQSTLQTALGLSSAPNIQFYYPDLDSNGNWNTAHGKVIFTYNGDIFGDGTKAAYQLYAGNLIGTPNNSPTMTWSLSSLVPDSQAPSIMSDNWSL